MRIGERAGLRAGTRQMRDAFGDALLEVAREDARIVALDGDLSSSTGMGGMRREFPARFFNMGIAEANLVGVSAGLAANGFIPFVGSLPAFLLPNAFDQLRLQVAIAGLNVKLLGSHAGISTGREGPTSMSIEDLALVGGLPTFTILVPSDEHSMAAAVQAAAAHEGPVYIRSSRGEFPQVYRSGLCSITIGKSNVLQQGTDVTIVACGLMTGVALDAAAELADGGIQARVIDMISVQPIDRDAVTAAARETGALVTAEEHLVKGGLGASVAQVTAEMCPVPVRFIGIHGTYLESASVDELMVRHHLTAGDIAHAAREAIGAKSANSQKSAGRG